MGTFTGQHCMRRKNHTFFSRFASRSFRSRISCTGGVRPDQRLESCIRCRHVIEKAKVKSWARDSNTLLESGRLHKFILLLRWVSFVSILLLSPCEKRAAVRCPSSLSQPFMDKAKLIEIHPQNRYTGSWTLDK